MTIRSKAPLRISFAGGGTDVSPYLEERGGVVLSATIDKYAYGSLNLRDDTDIGVHSLDYEITARFRRGQELAFNGELDLVKAVLKTFGQDDIDGMDVLIHSDAPPGSGLGSSSTMVVALLGLLKHLRKLPLTNYEIAELAYHSERIELGIQGGMQDQYAAAFGGFNLMEFNATGVVVNPLRIDRDVINELQYNLLLCYTGKTRLSGNIIATQKANYVRRDEEVVQAMDEMKQITIEMKNSLLQGRLDSFGEMLHESWVNKKKMAQQITTTTVDALYDAARAEGALGGKLLGAGGGGYLLVYCSDGKKHKIASALEKLGGTVVGFTFVRQGLQTWEVKARDASRTVVPQYNAF
ncbi:MAG: hypothetical protein ACC628_00580 [Pirellulaceae bacterium]